MKFRDLILTEGKRRKKRRASIIRRGYMMGCWGSCCHHGCRHEDHPDVPDASDFSSDSGGLADGDGGGE